MAASGEDALDVAAARNGPATEQGASRLRYSARLHFLSFPALCWCESGVSSTDWVMCHERVRSDLVDFTEESVKRLLGAADHIRRILDDNRH